MVEEQDIMQHDENNNSDENAILTVLTLAIKDVMRYEGKLLEIQCSERAIVHWLANYFMKHIVRVVLGMENAFKKTKKSICQKILLSSALQCSIWYLTKENVTIRPAMFFA